jgi:precorrin-6B methylase 2
LTEKNSRRGAEALGLLRAHPLKTLRALRGCLGLLAGRTGYLSTTGWFRSLVLSSSVDARGEPLPWITYASLRFIESKLSPDMEVFEFGSGASTLWWARRVRHVVSCEDDREWLERTRARAPENVHLIHATSEGQAYSSAILPYTARFDLVVIDGSDRVDCARNSLGALKPGGVILWDNTDREQYRPGFELLRDQGFRRVDFVGMTPINLFECSTSIFYRDRNCLGL